MDIQTGARSVKLCTGLILKGPEEQHDQKLAGNMDFVTLDDRFRAERMGLSNEQYRFYLITERFCSSINRFLARKLDA